MAQTPLTIARSGSKIYRRRQGVPGDRVNKTADRPETVECALNADVSADHQ